MSGILLSFVACAICDVIGLYLVRLCNTFERDNIVEIGYRSHTKKYKKPCGSVSAWDRTLHWSLCKDAKIKKKSIWIYFACNAYLVVAAVVSIIISCILAICYVPKDALFYKLGYYIIVFAIWGGAHLVLDLLFLPSEQRRYGMRVQGDQKRK